MPPLKNQIECCPVIEKKTMVLTTGQQVETFSNYQTTKSQVFMSWTQDLIAKKIFVMQAKGGFANSPPKFGSKLY